jgi:RNA-directed DNA polymerase
MHRLTFKFKKNTKKNLTPEQRLEAKELWAKVRLAGGSRNYVNQELRKLGVFVQREDVLLMSPQQKKAYVERVEKELEFRKPLQTKVWEAYTATHIVHLGEDVFWTDEVDIDHFDITQREQRLHDLGLPKLDSLEELSQALSLTIPELRWLSYHREVASSIHYQRFELPKKTGGVRKIWAPMPKLKMAQSWILRNIAEKLAIHGSAHGFIQGRSIYSNAVEHQNAKLVVGFDLENFFPTLSFRRVKGIFRKAGYLEGIATILALLCTEAPREEVELNGKKLLVALGQRCLPQGSPASPALSNAACLRMDRRLLGWAQKNGWRYTRYADDLTFSIDEQTQVHADIKQLISFVTQISIEEGFKINEDKTKVMGKGNRQEITGLVINDQQAPRVPREVRKKVRAMLHRLKTGKGLKEGTTRNTLIGYIAFINMCDPIEAEKRLNELQGI